MDTRAAQAWIDAWLRIWPSRDPEPVASLYADQGVFLSHPFREPLFGSAGARECIESATADQAAVAFAEPIVSGNRAAVEWWAVTTARDGSEETIAETSVIRFDENGVVLEDCAYWVSKPGRREPPQTFRAAARAQG